MGHSLGTCAKFSRKPLFLAVWYTHAHVQLPFSEFHQLLLVYFPIWSMSNVLSLSSCIPPFSDFSKILIALLTFPFSISLANVVASFLLFVETLVVFYSLSSIALPSNIRWSICPFFQRCKLHCDASESSFVFELKGGFCSNIPGFAFMGWTIYQVLSFLQWTFSPVFQLAIRKVLFCSARLRHMQSLRRNCRICLNDFFSMQDRWYFCMMIFDVF